MVNVFYHGPVDAVMPLNYEGLNFDDLAGWKHQKCQNFPRQNFVLYAYWHSC